MLCGVVKRMRRYSLIVGVCIFIVAGAFAAAPLLAAQESVRRDTPTMHGNDLGRVMLRPLDPEEIITCDAVRQMQIKNMPFRIFDARNKAIYDYSHITGAILPTGEEFFKQQDLAKRQVIPIPPNPDVYLEKTTEKYPRDVRIVTYCDPGCSASAMLLLKLKALGFINVKSMAEGFTTWEKKGYPVTIGTPPLEEAPPSQTPKSKTLESKSVVVS